MDNQVDQDETNPEKYQQKHIIGFIIEFCNLSMLIPKNTHVFLWEAE